MFHLKYCIFVRSTSSTCNLLHSLQHITSKMGLDWGRREHDDNTPYRNIIRLEKGVGSLISWKRNAWSLQRWGKNYWFCLQPNCYKSTTITFKEKLCFIVGSGIFLSTTLPSKITSRIIWKDMVLKHGAGNPLESSSSSTRCHASMKSQVPGEFPCSTRPIEEDFLQ